MGKLAPFLLEKSFADQGLLKYWVYVTWAHPKLAEKPAEQWGTHFWGGNAAGRGHRRNTDVLLCKGKAVMRLNFSSASPTNTLHLTPAPAPGCHTSSAGRSAANRISPSCFAFKWLITTCCKTLHRQGGKRFYNSLYSEPWQQRKPPPARTVWGSTHDPGEQKPRPAASPHLPLTEPASYPNPSSCPSSRMPLGHSMLRNSLSAKRQRQLLQKQNKIEYNKEQRVCRANCCSGKTPSWLRAAPTGSVPDLPPSCHATG